MSLRAALASWPALAGWGALVAVMVALLEWDLRRRNARLPRLMRWVWRLTVLYSGPLGLWAYAVAGRRQIPDDALWRRGLRSVAHCYSGCGLGEIVGVLITVGVLSLSAAWVAGVTFVLAYVAGFGLTLGPLLHDGEPLPTAIRDTAASESASITVMEVTAIGVGLALSLNRPSMGEPLFWSSMVVSLTAGLAAAYPVNLLLLRAGVKGGMHDPRRQGA